MKVFFAADGSLNVTGEDATEWLALSTWADRFVGEDSILNVRVQKPGFYCGIACLVDNKIVFRRADREHVIPEQEKPE